MSMLEIKSEVFRGPMHRVQKNKESSFGKKHVSLGFSCELFSRVVVLYSTCTYYIYLLLIGQFTNHISRFRVIDTSITTIHLHIHNVVEFRLKI